MFLVCKDPRDIVEVDVRISTPQVLHVGQRRNLGECQVDDALEVVQKLGLSFEERYAPKPVHYNGEDLLLVHQREVSEVLLGSWKESSLSKSLQQGNESKAV